jgi:peptidoglycan/xylan/chitin deacetylase (PgdA/CDA1 family)
MMGEYRTQDRYRAAIGRRLAAAIRTKGMAIKPERPIVSFTFDDAPLTAATNGARLLEAAGTCGTYYVAGELCGESSDGRPFLNRDELARLNERGHELACHTFSHVRASGLSAAQFSAEATRNQTYVSSQCGDVRLTSFAYPFGDVSLARKLQAQSMFASCRGISPGLNSGVADLGLLKAVALYAESRDDTCVETWLDKAGRERGWLIFYTHDVEDRPSQWGASPEQLGHAIRASLDRGYEILTVRNALGRLAWDQWA